MSADCPLTPKRTSTRMILFFLHKVHPPRRRRSKIEIATWLLDFCMFPSFPFEVTLLVDESAGGDEESVGVPNKDDPADSDYEPMLPEEEQEQCSDEEEDEDEDEAPPVGDGENRCEFCHTIDISSKFYSKTKRFCSSSCCHRFSASHQVTLWSLFSFTFTL